jgi:hypothetical protein
MKVFLFKKPSLFLTVTLLAMVFTACMPEEVKLDPDKEQYFDLITFLDVHSKKLVGENAKQVTKTIEMESRTEEAIQESGELTDMLKEFRRFNLNKPAYRGIFNVNDTLSDDGSMVRSYIPDEKANISLTAFYVHYEPGTGQDSVQKLKMRRERSNILYNSHETGIVEINGNKIFRAELQNYQQILFFQPTEFRVTITVND